MRKICGNEPANSLILWPGEARAKAGGLSGDEGFMPFKELNLEGEI
jgi:hypothetical protein